MLFYIDTVFKTFQNVSNFGFSESGPGERFQGSVSVKVVPEKGFRFGFSKIGRRRKVFGSVSVKVVPKKCFKVCFL